MSSEPLVVVDGVKDSAPASDAVSHRSQQLAQFQVAAVMGTGQAFFPVYVMFAIAAGLIIQPAVTHSTLLVWMAAYLGYTVLRTVATTEYHKDIARASPKRVLQWRHIIFMSAAGHGLLLGSLALIAMPNLSPGRQLVLTCFVLLVTTGSTIYVAAVLPALVALITLTLLPFVIAWEMHDASLELPVSRFLLVAWIINLFLSWTHYRVACRVFELAASNEDLVKALSSKNEELKAADRARVQLLGVTSHDLRQPVHALGLILAQTSEFDGTKVLKQHFDKLREVSDLIAEMLLELMDLSSLESNKHARRMEAVSLSAILDQLKTSQEPSAKRKGLALHIHADCDIRVQADASLLRRILLNLLSNAIKYTVVGSVVVECSLRAQHAVISVRDTGIGIPRERIDEIFQPYVRLNPFATDRDGVGLGLSIVRRAAAVQGLDIQVTSMVGIGSIFELTVPLTEDWQVPDACATTERIMLPPPGTCIAVVDDDLFAREALMTLLERWGYCAVSGAMIGDLLDALSDKDKPALIVTDYHLSRVDFGPDAILAVRRHFDDPLIPGILLTADTSVVLDGLDHVEIAYKPLNPMLLKELLGRMTSTAYAQAIGKNSNESRAACTT